MARPDSEKCRRCAKLTAQEAQQRHGAQGDGCWEPAHCHNRRSYYRHRARRNQNRKQQRQLPQSLEAMPRGAISPSVILEVSVPAVPAAVVHWYRQRQDAPLHAVGAVLWLGNQQVATISPVHCLGLTELQVKTLLVRILEVFSQHSGITVDRFRSSVELHPQNCPIRPCPLYPEIKL